MADDGKVTIIVITNAESVAKQFQVLDKAIDKTAKDGKKLDSTAKILKNSIQSLVAVFGIRQIIRFNKELVNTTLKLEGLDNRLISSVGSVNLAQRAYKFITEETERLGLGLEEALSGFAGFSAAALRSNLTFEETKQIFSDVGSALTVLGKGTAETGFVFRALEQIASKGTVSMEELKRQLGDTLPGALAIAAKSMNLAQKDFIKLVEAGEVVSKDFLPAFAREIKKSLGSNVEQASQSARANFNRLKNSILLLKDSLGQQLVPTLVEFSKEIRSFIDNEGTSLIKLFAIISDSVFILVRVLKAAETGFKALGIILNSFRKEAKSIADVKERMDIIKQAFEELGEEGEEDIQKLIEAFKNFGEIEVAENRLRNLADAGEDVNDKLVLKESIFEKYKRLLGELITIEDVASTIGDNLADALTTPFEEGETAADRFKKVMLDILREISRQLIATGISRAIISSFGAPTAPAVAPSAKGNIFNNGNIIPFARGGIVNSPTLFPMQNGVGLMGESGPEAILPLKRGRNGKLGVETSGEQGGNINIFNQSQSRIEVIKRPNNDRDIFVREFNSTLAGERSKGAFESALQTQRLSGVQAS